MFVLALVGAYLARNRFVGPFLLARFQPRLERELGGTLRIANFGGDWWHGIELEGVRFQRTAASGPLVEVEGAALAARVSWLALARGDLAGLHSLTLSAERVELAPESPLGGAPTEAPSSEPFTLPTRLPTLDVRIGTLAFTLADETPFSFDDVRLTAKDGAEIALDVAATHLEAMFPRWEGWPLAMRAAWNGADVRVAGATLGALVGVADGRVDLTRVGEGRVAWQAPARIPRNADAGGALRVDGEVSASGALALDVTAKDVALTALHALWPALEGALEAAPSGTLRSLTARIESGSDGGAPWNFELAAALDAPAFAGIALEHLDVQGALAGTALRVQTLEARDRAGHVRARGLELPLDGGLGAILEAARGTLEVELDDLPELFARGRAGQPAPEWEARLGAHRVALELTAGGGALDVRQGRISLADGSAELRRGELRFGRDAEDPWSGATFSLDGDVDLPDLAPLGALVGEPELRGSLRGAVHLEGPVLAPRGTLQGTFAGLERGSLALGDGALELDADGERLHVARLEAQCTLWDVEAQGSLAFATGALDGVALRARLGSLADVGAAFLGDDSPFGGGTLEAELSLQGSLAAPEGVLKVDVQDARVGGTVLPRLELATRIHPDRLELESLAGTVGEIDVQASGALAFDPERRPARATLSTLELRRGADALVLDEESALVWGDDAITLEPLALSGAGGTLRASGHLPRGAPDAPLLLQVEARLSDLALLQPALAAALGSLSPQLAGTLEVQASLEGTPAKVTGTAWLAGTELALALEHKGRPLDFRSPGFQLELAFDDAITLSDGRIVIVGFGELELAGRVEHALDLEALTSGAIDGYREAPTAARASLRLDSLEGLRPFLDEVRSLGGRLEAGLSVTGTLGAPTLAGEATLEDGELRLSSAVPNLREVQARLAFDGAAEDALRIERCEGLLGGATFRLEGRVEHPFRAPELALALKGDEVLLYRDATTRVRANTDLHLDGALNSLRLSGELSLTEGVYSAPVRLLSGLTGEAGPPSAGRGLDLAFARSGPIANLRLDLRVRSADPFRLKNNLVEGGLRPVLDVHGTGAVPLLDGNVFVEPTLVALPSGRLTLDSGRIAFDERDPFVPKLDLSGHTRLKGYDVTTLISGDYDDPTIRLSSTPPLPNQDLLVLFLTGQLPEGSTADRGRGAAQSVAVYLAKDFLTRWLAGGDADEESLLERLDFEIGGDVTQSGALTTEARYYLSRRARGGGRENYLAAERDVYDKINFGWGIRFLFE